MLLKERIKEKVINNIRVFPPGINRGFQSPLLSACTFHEHLHSLREREESKTEKCETFTGIFNQKIVHIYFQYIF